MANLPLVHPRWAHDDEIRPSAGEKCFLPAAAAQARRPLSESRPGERKNDMNSISDRFCAAARRHVLPGFEIEHAASVPEVGRPVLNQVSDDAQQGVPDGCLAASGE
jgi:hypothetical protein